MKRLLLSVLTLFALSCENPSPIDTGTPPNRQEHNENTLKVINGAFAFETIDDFEATAKKIGNLSNKDYSNWQKSYNIKTQYSEYLSLSPNVPLKEQSKKHPELVFFNEKTNSYELNSVNSNYAKITNDKGIVIINNASYQFSAKEIKCIRGSDQAAINTLLTSARENYQANNIKFSTVEEGFKPRKNAKMGPWEKEQKGNGIYDMPGWDGAYYVKSKLRCRYYWIPNPNPVFPGMDIGKMAIEIEGSYYRERSILNDQQQQPQQYSVTWAFELSDRLNFGTYFPYTGNYTESGIQSFSRVLFDGFPCDIRNLNIPVTAMDFNKNGASVTSTTTFVVTN
jgi:hypothetical protein